MEIKMNETKKKLAKKLFNLINLQFFTIMLGVFDVFSLIINDNIPFGGAICIVIFYSFLFLVLSIVSFDIFIFKKLPVKRYHYLGFIIVIYYFMHNFFELTTNLQVKPENLQSYSGFIFEPYNECEYSFNKEHLGVKRDLSKDYVCRPSKTEEATRYIYFSNNQDYKKPFNTARRFICNLRKKNSCKITEKFYNHQNLTVKYSTITLSNILLFPPFIPLFKDYHIIYEVSKDNKIIYSYDYFVKQYQKTRLYFFSLLLYLLLNAIIFTYFYKKIQNHEDCPKYIRFKYNPKKFFLGELDYE